MLLHAEHAYEGPLAMVLPRPATRRGAGVGGLPHAAVPAVVPGWSKAVKSAAVEAARSSTRGRGWAPSGPASSWECRAAQSRQALPEGAQAPSWGTARTALWPCCPARSSSRAPAATASAATPRSARRRCTQPRSCGSAGRGRPRWRRPASNRAAAIEGVCRGTTPFSDRGARRVGAKFAFEELDR